MSDPIRREDALRVTLAYSSSYSAEQAETAIRALPAVQPDADELVGHMTKLIAAGLDRVEQLTAELASADAMIEAQAKDHASNNIRFAEATHRAEVAEAEVTRLQAQVRFLERKVVT